MSSAAVMSLLVVDSDNLYTIMESWGLPRDERGSQQLSAPAICDCLYQSFDHRPRPEPYYLPQTEIPLPHVVIDHSILD
jgi:hypothetical protein